MDALGKQFRPPTLVVSVQEGRNLSDGPTGKAVDAYCVVKLGKLSEKTRTVKGQRNPTFSQQFTFPVSEEDEFLEVEVWDWDRVTSDDKLGTIKIQLSPALTDWKEHDLWYSVIKHKGPISSQPETLGSREPSGKGGQIRLRLRLYNDKKQEEERERKRLDDLKRQQETMDRERGAPYMSARMSQKRDLQSRSSRFNVGDLSPLIHKLSNIMLYFCIGQMLFAFLIALYRADLTCAISLFGLYGATEKHAESVLMYLVLTVISTFIDITWIIIEAQYLSLLTSAEYARMGAAEASLTGTRTFALVASVFQLVAKIVGLIFVIYLFVQLRKAKNNARQKRTPQKRQNLNTQFAGDGYNMGGEAPPTPSYY